MVVTSVVKNQIQVFPWGIPILRISTTWSDNEIEMSEDIVNTTQETLRAAGFEIMSVGREISKPGPSIHEAGTARMGNHQMPARPAPNLQMTDNPQFFL